MRAGLSMVLRDTKRVVTVMEGVAMPVGEVKSSTKRLSSSSVVFCVWFICGAGVLSCAPQSPPGLPEECVTAVERLGAVKDPDDANPPKLESSEDCLGIYPMPPA